MADLLPAIRQGLATNLATIDGFQVTPYMLASPTPPSIHVFPDEVDYDEASHRGLDVWTFTVQAFVGLQADRGAQAKLDKLLEPTGATSVKAAVEADRTLGGAIEDLRVVKCSGYELYELAGRGAVLGAKWTVEVLALGA